MCEHDSDDWRDGYLTGFAAGRAVGYGKRLTEEEELWAAIADHVRRHARMKTWAEVTQAREETA